MYKQGNILCFSVKAKIVSATSFFFYVHEMEKHQGNNVSSFEQALRHNVTPPKYIDIHQLTGKPTCRGSNASSYFHQQKLEVHCKCLLTMIFGFDQSSALGIHCSFSSIMKYLLLKYEGQVVLENIIFLFAGKLPACYSLQDIRDGRNDEFTGVYPAVVMTACNCIQIYSKKGM